MALSKNSFEGAWPAPCELPSQAQALKSCASFFWKEISHLQPPSMFRFYANGLFAVSRNRIHARPQHFYERLLNRFTGRAPLQCIGGLHKRFVTWANSTRHVPAEADCLMLEKIWHIIFGEQPVMPSSEKYNYLRFPYFRGVFKVNRFICD